MINEKRGHCGALSLRGGMLEEVHCDVFFEEIWTRKTRGCRAASHYHPPQGILCHGNEIWGSLIRWKGAYIQGAPTTRQDGFPDANHVNNICHSSRTGYGPGYFLGSHICSFSNPAEQRCLFHFLQTRG